VLGRFFEDSLVSGRAEERVEGFGVRLAFEAISDKGSPVSLSISARRSDEPIRLSKDAMIPSSTPRRLPPFSRTKRLICMSPTLDFHSYMFSFCSKKSNHQSGAAQPVGDSREHGATKGSGMHIPAKV
jgi:hypothetical protein